MEAYQELEKRFGKWSGCNNPNTVAVASGTAALHVALEALELPQGSEIIIPDFTMVACARAAVMAGLKPVFVDCGEDLNINPFLLKHARTPKTSAIMAVHIYGRQCAMGDIHTFAQHYGLKVIEDMAEIHGVAPHPNTDAACWSFYKNKIIHGEEGGMISFKDSQDAEKARSLRSLGFTEAHDFNHIPRGVNARMSNAHAKLILDSLNRVQWSMMSRWRIEDVYNEMIPREWQMPTRSAVWVYDVICPRGTDTARLVKDLNTIPPGVGARLAFKPMHTQAEFMMMQHTGLKCVTADDDRIVSEEMSQRVIYLPVNPVHTDDTIRSYSNILLSLLSPAG